MSEAEDQSYECWIVYGVEDGVMRSMHAEEPTEVPDGCAVVPRPKAPPKMDPDRGWYRIDNGQPVQLTGNRLKLAQIGPIRHMVSAEVLERAEAAIARLRSRGLL